MNDNFHTSLKHPNRRTVGQKGYRLHDTRIAHSNGQGAMRSIKYELKNPSHITGNLSDQIARAIVDDHKWLYGNINLNDYLTWRAGKTDQQITAGEREYSFLGFWLEALKLGFVFSNKITPEFQTYLGIKTAQAKLFELMPPKIAAKLNRAKWQDFILNNIRPASGTPASVKRKITALFLDAHQNSAAATKITAAFFEKCQKGEQNDLSARLELFGITQKLEIPKSAPIYWACSPNFNPQNFQTADRTALTDKLIAYWVGEVGETQAKKFLSLGENGNHFNNGILGEFFEVCRKNDTELKSAAQKLAQIFELDKSAEQEIHNRFQKLANYAQNLPAQPTLIDKWADYRSNFNGAIESWHSNRAAKQNTAKSQITELQNLLAQIAQNLPENNEINQDILQKTLACLNSAGDKISRHFSTELESYLAALKTALNEWAAQNKSAAQKLWDNIKRKTPDGKTTKINWQSGLGRHIQSSPLFFGESKREEWEQIFHLKTSTATETAKLIKILCAKTNDKDLITSKQVDALSQLFLRLKNDKDHNPEIFQRLTAIAAALRTDFNHRDEHHRYYRSGFERAKFHDLTFTHITIAKLLKLANPKPLFEKSKTAPEENNLLRDTTQLSKIVLSAKLMNAEREVQRQAELTHANLQGYAALFSKREFIARYTVQAANGAQCVLGIAKDSNKKGRAVDRYFYAFPKISPTFTAKTNFQKISAKNPAHAPKDITAPKNHHQVGLKVASSKYQIQFLDWFFGNHRRKKTTLELGGAFTIAEQTVIINWRGKNPVAATSDSRIFVSQPFTLIPPNQKDQKPPAPAKNRFLGVDIGEYGLAWSLIEANQNQITELEHGFIADRQQKILKGQVKIWRENQVRQTFTSLDTKVARIRASLIGSFRNQLEDLAIKKRATLSFEYEVSSFEAGGHRVAKVYDSIKRADVKKPDNYPQNDQTWGKKSTYHWAQETTAAGTSQFCTKCKRWSSLAVTDDHTYELQPYTDHLFKTQLDDGNFVRLYAPDHQAGDKIKGKDGLKNMIYKAMRPNDDGQGFAIITRQIPSAKLQNFGKNKPRGNIALFVCPYTDCHHVTDADHQAAFNIAVRGYIKSQETAKNPKKSAKTGYFSRDFLTQAAAKLDFQPINL